MDKYRELQAGQTQDKVIFTSQQYIPQLDLFTPGLVELSSAPLYAGEIGKRSGISTVRSIESVGFAFSCGRETF